MELGINVENQIKNFTTNYYSKFKITLLFFALFSVFAIPLVSSDAFANHLSEKMKWQLVFISSEPGCANYHYQMANKFHYLTGAYLNEYGIENESYSPKCIPEVKYQQNYEKPNDLDLFVLVYDKNLGEEILQSNDVGGFYKHFGLDLVDEIVNGNDIGSFDLTGDGIVNTEDLEVWRATAAEENGFAAPYLMGDANLDGSVNAADLNALGQNWLAHRNAWQWGDFTADGTVDISDLNLLAQNWQQSISNAVSPASVPEPTGMALFCVAAFLAALPRGRSRAQLLGHRSCEPLMGHSVSNRSDSFATSPLSVAASKVAAIP